jgi:Ras-related protein Rab-1A
MSIKEDVILKILVLGDSAVGKTSLSLQYVENYFPESYISTVGVEYKNKPVKLNNTNILLQIWDTCGQERYKSLSKTFMKGADGILFVYDISNKQTFDHIKDWIMESQNSNNEFKKIIVGNKIDLPPERRKVSQEVLTKYSNDKKIQGIETSAKSGENVEKAFLMLTKLIIGNMTKEEIIKKFGKTNKDNTILRTSNKIEKKKKFC